MLQTTASRFIVYPCRNLSNEWKTQSTENKSLKMSIETVLKDKKDVEDEYICDWQPCYRDYDLNPCDPNKPSIHILVDDVLMKIMEYLPLGERIYCEIVCRRWRALVNAMFESITELNIVDRKYVINKTKVVQLFPNIKFQYFQLKHAPYLYFHNSKALKACTNLKCFSTNKCSQFDENLLRKLISVWPCLTKMCVSWSSIKGDCFNLLPEGLKELNISGCFDVSKENLLKISKVCRNLEVLKIQCFEVDKEFLEELGHNCINLRRLQLKTPIDVDLSDHIQMFTRLISLELVAYTFELANIADYVKDLEELHIKFREETTNMVDFGKFSNLKKVYINFDLRKQELMSIEKCKKMENVTIWKCDEIDQDFIKKIAKGCTKIKHIACPWVRIDINFIADINEMMKNRSEPIKFTVQKELPEAHYDKKKIVFDFINTSLYEVESDDDDVIYEFESGDDDVYEFESGDEYIYEFESDDDMYEVKSDEDDMYID